jgi:hypothetical protein
MINRRFDDRAPCLAWMSPKQALAGKPRIHLPASGIGGHESGENQTDESGPKRRIAGVFFGSEGSIRLIPSTSGRKSRRMLVPG